MNARAGLLLVTTLVAAGTITACGDPDPSVTTTATDAPTSSFTPDPEPTRTYYTSPTPFGARNNVIGPADPTDVLASTNLGEMFIADFSSGLIYELHPYGTPCWLDDNTLVDAHRTLFVLDDADPPDVDPSFDQCPVPADRLLPRAGGRTWDTPEMTASADGIWSIERNEQGAYITGASHEFIPIPDTNTFAWSPMGHTLAVGGGWCGAEPPLQIIHPDAGETIPVTGIEGRPLAYVWAPDASAIIVGDAYMEGGPRLRRVAASDGAATSTWPAGEIGSVSPIIPLAVSPDGTRVLFYIYSFRGCS
jgi:hypothetical protein